ncbi:hypothetical protein ACV7JQ_07105 [Globicatella sulfidifaciens]
MQTYDNEKQYVIDCEGSEEQEIALAYKGFKKCNRCLLMFMNCDGSDDKSETCLTCIKNLMEE